MHLYIRTSPRSLLSTQYIVLHVHHKLRRICGFSLARIICVLHKVLEFPVITRPCPWTNLALGIDINMRLAGPLLAAALHSLQLSGVIAQTHEQRPLAGLGPDRLSHAWAGGTQGKKPNIVFVLTDDQDLHMQSLDYLPLVKKHLTDQGTFYKRHYCTTAICCPSRVSLWTGKLAHNTNVTDVNPPYGM